jgi:hypothetical protein
VTYMNLKTPREVPSLRHRTLSVAATTKQCANSDDGGRADCEIPTICSHCVRAPDQRPNGKRPHRFRFTNADNIGNLTHPAGTRLTLEALTRYTNSGLAKPGEHLHEDIAARMFEVAKPNAWR